MKRWTHAYQVAFDAYMACLANEQHEFETLPQMCERLWRYLQAIGPKNLWRLPPSTLHLLQRALEDIPSPSLVLLDGDLSSFKEPVNSAIARLTPKKNSPLVRAQILAHYILNDIGSSVRLIRFAQTLFKKGQAEIHPHSHPTAILTWHDLEEEATQHILQTIQRCLDTLRDPTADTDSKLAQLAQLSTYVAYTPFWDQVEHIIIQSIFAWPLLVVQGKYPFSLPVAIDVLFHYELNNAQQIRIVGTEALDLRRKDKTGEDWESHLKRVVKVAKDVWRAKHGNYGDANNVYTFRYAVENATIRLDFQYATQIVHDLPKVSLSEGSADAYFAQFILMRFLGKKAHLSSSISGGIGPQCRNKKHEPTFNYYFGPLGGVLKKLQYAFLVESHVRIVLPRSKVVRNQVTRLFQRTGPIQSAADAAHSQIVSARHFQTADVLYASTMYDLANEVQVGGWTQFQYIRCPEVAWAIHQQHNKDSHLRPKIKLILDRLNRNTESCLTLASVSPTTLALALRYINDVIRKRKRQDQPPSLSWLFIRAIPEEQEERFWWVVWNSIGAPYTTFKEFLTNPHRADKLLADLLNQDRPSENSYRHRAPDILVITDTKVFKEYRQRIQTPEAFSFSPISLVDRIRRNEALRITCHEQLQQHLGNTRIILISTVVSFLSCSVS